MLTRKHFTAFAAVLRDHRASFALARAIADVCLNANPNFDRTRFYEAAGIRVPTPTPAERIPSMQIYNIVLEVDLENYQTEALAAMDELIVARVAEMKALGSLVTNTTVDAFITRQGPYGANVSIDTRHPTDQPG